MQHLPITASRPLRPAKATDLAPAVSPAAFQATENTSLVHARPGSTPISQPAVLNVPPDQLSFTGPYFLLPHIGRAPPAFPRQTLAPDLTLTRLSNVICLPGQIALAPAGGEHTLLMESLSNEWQRDSIHIDKTDDHTFSLREPIGPVEQLPGRYLYLCNMHSPHFGHFLVDVLSMCWGFQAARALGIELRVLVERHLPGYLAPLLEACGIPPSAITPVTCPLSCAEVFFATRSFFTQGWTTPAAMATWRLIRDALDEGEGPEKVYVSRRHVGNRALLNESEVEACFRRRGFFIAYPEQLSIRHQVTLWANARVLAGTAGSNMFGLAFQRRLQRCLIINSPNLLHFQEMFLQAGYGSETSFYIGEDLDGKVHSSWRVVIADLERHVDAWLGGTGQRQQAGPRRIATKNIEPYLRFFDEAFYLSRYADIRDAVANGGFPSGRYHFETVGFAELRHGFAFDEFWYAGAYPAVANEIAQGNFIDYMHHYVTIGHLIGCSPVRPSAAATGSQIPPVIAPRYGSEPAG